jgi:hypothetical protein
MLAVEITLRLVEPAAASRPCVPDVPMAMTVAISSVRPCPSASRSCIADRLSIVDHHSRSGYRTSSPVIARPISIRWISDVPSKMVKILAAGTVPQFSGLRTPVVSARIRHAPSER